MAISPAMQSGILALTAGMFNMSAGGNYLSNFANYVTNIQANWGLNDDDAMAELARALVKSPAFQEKMIGKVTPADQAMVILTNFGLQADSALLASTTAAIAGFGNTNLDGKLAALIWGYTKGLTQDVTVMNAYPTAAALLTNKVAVSQYYSVTNPLTTTDLATLQKTLSVVSSDPATIALAENAATSSGQAYILTNATDSITANLFESGLVYTPSGTSRINALQDEDTLIGTGTNPTLNVTLGNIDALNAGAQGTTVTPSLKGIEVINVAFTGSGGGATNQLDVQDARGITDAINITRISDGVPTGTIDNIGTDGVAPVALSVSNSGQVGQSVFFTYKDGAAVTGSADNVALKVSNVNLATLSVSGINDGIETINLSSEGSPNKIGTLNAEDLVTLNITGAQNLTLGGRANVTGAQFVEATHYTAGLSNVAGSLQKVDASTLLGALDYTIGAEINAGKDNTSGVNIDLQVTGGINNDTFRLAADSSINAKDVINGGAGNNTLVMFGGTSQITADTAPNVKSIQNLEIRTGQDAAAVADVVTINANAFDSLANIYVRNEGQLAVGTAWNSAAEGMTTTLNGLSSAQANAVTLAHGTTGNSSIGNNVLSVNLSDATGAADSAKVTLVDGVNADTVFNANIAVQGIENMTIADNDSESNTIHLNNSGAAPAGSKLTITGGSAGTYFNLDTLTAKTIVAATAAAGAMNGYGYATTGGAGNSTTALAAGTRDTAVATVFRDTPATTPATVLKPLAIAAPSNQMNVEIIDASAELSDMILRVGDITRTNGVSSQSITTGSGNDSIIFDATNNSNAGYSSGDTVAAGTGNDTLIIDGESLSRINIQKSEWDNTTGIDTLRLAGNASATNVGSNKIVSDTGGSYYIEIDNEFVRQTDAGNGLRIISNDGDLSKNSESDLVLDLRTLTQASNINFTGANGNGAAANASNRVLVSDNSANGLNTLNGGDTIVNEAISTGNNNVLEVFDTAQLSINDFANVKDFGRIEATNDVSTAQTLTLQLNNTVMDQLVDSATAASTTNIERLVITANSNNNVAAAIANLDIDASTVSNAFGLDIIAARGSVNTIKGTAGADKVVLLGNYTTTEQIADGHAGVTLFAGLNEAASTLTGNTLAVNAVAYKGVDGIAGTADDVLLAYTGNYQLGVGDTIEIFGGIDLTGVTIAAGTSILAHSSIKLSESQLNNLSSVTFAGASAHGLTVTDSAGVVSADLNKVVVGNSTGTLTVTTELGVVTTGTVAIQANGTPATVNGVVGTTATLTPSAASVDEASSVTFTLANQAAGTYNVSVTGTGITAGDYTVTSTPVTVGADGTGTFTVNATADVTTEGAETMSVSVAGLSQSVVINDTSMGGTITPTTAAVAISAEGSHIDAGNTVNTTYNITAGTNYTYTISGFGSGDKLVFPAGNTPSVVNDDWADGIVDLTYASNGTVTTIHLTGLSGTQDAALNDTTGFNTVFSIGTIA